MLSHLEPFRLRGSFIGDLFLKHCLTLFLLLLLVKPMFGQQEQPPELASLLAAAQRAQAANNYATAAESYKQAVKFRPDMPELWANLGLMQHQTGDYTAAIGSFEKANRLKASLYVPNLFLGIDYMRTGKTKQAIPFLLAAKKMNETDPLPSLTLGRAYSSLEEWPPAIHELRRAIQIDPRQSSAWFALGIVYLDQLERDSRTMTERNASSSYANTLFAESLVKQSRYKEAASLYKTVLAAPDRPPCIQSEQGFLDLMMGDAQAAGLGFSTERRNHPECTLALLGLARLRIDAAANEEAVRFLNAAWSRDRGFFTANAPVLFEGISDERAASFFSLSAEQRSSGKLESAMHEALARARQGTPTPSALPSGGMVAMQDMHDWHASPVATPHEAARGDYSAGRYGQCAERLRGTLRSGNAGTLEMLAACSFFTGEYDLSSDAGYALRALPSQPTVATLYWSIKANEKLAFASLSRFQELEPNSARSHILLGDIYRQREQYSDAQREYSEALEISPNGSAALLGLGSAYLQEAKVEQAIATARRALEESPSDPEVNLLMGEALVTQHKFPDAEPFLLKSLSAKPQMLPHVHAMLGEVYAANGKTQEAIREMKLGLASDQDGSLHYQLARLYTKAGDKRDADVALAQMRDLQQKRRRGAVVALEDSHPGSLDYGP
jgi:tetratricopeptide (TPR) repeat protein